MRNNISCEHKNHKIKGGEQGCEKYCAEAVCVTPAIGCTPGSWPSLSTIRQSALNTHSGQLRRHRLPIDVLPGPRFTTKNRTQNPSLILILSVNVNGSESE